MKKVESLIPMVGYYHPSEDKIVLSHALFWVMTQNIRGKVEKGKVLVADIVETQYW